MCKAWLTQAPDKDVTLKLMPVVARCGRRFQATLLKKLASLGLDEAVPQLERKMDGKAEALFHSAVQPGIELQPRLQRPWTRLAALPIPRS